MKGWRRHAQQRRDEGSTLILVLALVVVGSLIVLPLLDYAISVSRHNTVLSSKTRGQEAVKAGLRTALADPTKLYHYCENHTLLPSPNISGINVQSTCHFIDYSMAEADEDLHLGLAATRVGETIPDGLEAIIQKEADGDPILDGNGNPLRFVFAPQTADPAEWLAPDPAEWSPSPLSEPRRIWLPNLPVHALSLRSSAGFQMPSGYPECTVYFPGTYTDPLVLDGPTYFTSGIYFFQNVVTVAAGADVVVGMGQHAGCTTDQEAAFYAVSAPATHNITGLGGTFIFGHNAPRDTDGKLVITNADGTPKLRFNQRYVNENDLGGQPSFGVSIASVNGKTTSGPDAQGRYVLEDLVVDGVNRVPASMVGIHDDVDSPPRSAGYERYQPSRLTHEPRPPTAPRWDASKPLIALRTGAASNDGAVRVRWNEPENFGGLPILEYMVTASPGGRTCVPTTTPLECIVTGLNHNTAYEFTVTATNAIGTSDPSAKSSATVANGGLGGTIAPRTTSAPLSSLASAPATPAAPTVVRYADETVHVSWTAPADNNSPISSYAVASNPPLDPVNQPCVLVSPTSCIIRNLPMFDPDDPLDLLDLVSDYVFTVTATNELGTSSTSPPSATLLLIPPAAGASPADPLPEPPIEIPAYEPPPIVDIDLSTTNPAVVQIPGYVSVPQGVFRLNNPNGLGTGDSKVEVSGGILAAAFRVVDDRAVAGALTVPIGLVNPVVQRTFKIVSRTTGSPPVTSTAIVQVNQNGAYAVNSWEVQ